MLCYRYITVIGLFLYILSVSPANSQETAVRPPGQNKTAKTQLLETGAAVLQPDAPLDAMNAYVVGFHPMKSAPLHQMEAHHFCKQVNEDFAQCALFDGNTKQANLTGVEYIISEKLFNTLPIAEKKYWHPHNYEILSGQLVAPRLPEAAEKAFMKTKINSYGKTWHLWDTGSVGRAGTKLPLGEPMLAWSFNQDGEAAPALIEERDRRMKVSTAKKQQSRADLVPLAKPQSGSDALKGKFKTEVHPD